MGCLPAMRAHSEMGLFMSTLCSLFVAHISPSCILDHSGVEGLSAHVINVFVEVVDGVEEDDKIDDTCRNGR